MECSFIEASGEMPSIVAPVPNPDKRKSWLATTAFTASVPAMLGLPPKQLEPPAQDSAENAGNPENPDGEPQYARVDLLSKRNSQQSSRSATPRQLKPRYIICIIGMLCHWRKCVYRRLKAIYDD